MRKTRGAFRVVAATVLLSGCASVVSDNDTTTYIHTVPETARCDLRGEEFERVINTPGSISLPSKAAPVSVTCTAAGYKPTNATLDTSVDGWIFGNIILGGIIGAVIDAGRGAGMRYPEELEVILEPEKFATAEQRDEFFDEWRSKAESKWAARIDDLDTQCSSRREMEPADCKMRKEQLQSNRSAEIAVIEGKRNSAVVEPSESVSSLDGVPE